MSLFSNKLKQYIENSGESIYQIAKKSNVDRTTIHKILTDDRNPSDEFVLKISDGLMLSPQEKEDLLEAYEISKIGEFTYNQRNQVKLIIEKIANEPQISDILKFDIVKSVYKQDDFQLKLINGNFSVNSIIKDIIEEGILKNEFAKIDFIIPTDYSLFYNELHVQYLKNPNIKIRHVISFSKKNSFTQNRNTNLDILSDLLSFALSSNTNYLPYYYYKNSFNIEIINIMPYFIIISDTLVTFDKEFKTAIIYKDKNIIDFYNNNFENILKMSKPLIKNFDNAYDIIMHYIENQALSLGDSCHWLEMQPCFGRYFTPDIVDKKMRKDIEYRDVLFDVTCKWFEKLAEGKDLQTSICSAEGINHFIENGIIVDLPPQYAAPFTKEEIYHLLCSFKKETASGKTKISIINPSNFTIPKNVAISFNKLSGINFCIFNIEKNIFGAAFLNEKSIVEAFEDFFTNLQNTKLVYSNDESLNILNGFIKLLETKLLIK